jgi:hypothetical protein
MQLCRPFVESASAPLFSRSKPIARACVGTRQWIALALLTVLLACEGSVCAAGSIALSDLDVKHVHVEDGPVGESHSLKTETGVVLGPGASMWVDLKGGAKSLTATVAPSPGSRGAPVRCRFATANDIVDLIVSEDSKPQDLSLNLTGHKLLIVEVYPTAPGGSGVRVHISPSSIVSEGERPEAWSGVASLKWTTSVWDLQIDGRSGGLTRLVHPKDSFGMNWIRPSALWGTGWADIGGKLLMWDRPFAFRRTGPREMEAVYTLPSLRIRVRRHVDAQDRLHESFTFENTGKELLVFGEGGLAILAPLFDTYPGAELCQTHRCHAHLWMGGTSAYINALRMGGAAPHLGLVVTQGSLNHYSIHNRVAHSNDRGQFALHPAPMTLAPGESHTVSWALFWHDGWDEFFARAAEIEQFIRLEAERYTVHRGDSLQLKARAATPLNNAKLTINGQPVPVQPNGKYLEAMVPLETLGEHVLELSADGRKTQLRAFVTPPVLELIKARVKFIVEKQQKRAPGDFLDGAYLIYDNEKESHVYEAGFSDHNAGRERLAMGTLVALYLPHCDDPELRRQLEESLRRYDAFVARELQAPNGTVFNDARRDRHVRMYNYPWVAHYHLAMYRAFGHASHLRKALDTCRAYYSRGGERFYCIGMPVLEMVTALREAGWKNEAMEMTARFRKHADRVLATGTAYPKHEVNYEQSIVGPAAQLLLEFHLLSGEQTYLAGAVQQMRLLELFNGHQPDYHLHEIAIRHWDGYWFGGRKTYGDTFPHYWSAITGHVFALYSRATGDIGYARRAQENFTNNLCLFTPDGRGSAAYVYPLTINEKPGRYLDPWANDQDWALVYWLAIFGRELQKQK